MTALARTRFSVVIPTYQRRDLVTRTVRAFERQEFDDFEVVVVIDGSTDGTADALRELGAGGRVRIVEQPNAGRAAAVNAGAAQASGEVLLILDDDMEPDPGLLSAHDRALRAGADIVLGHIPLHPDSPRNVLTAGVEQWAEERRQRLVAGGGEVPLDDLLTGQMAITREAFERVGGFDTSFTREGLFGGEDIDFGYRLVREGFRVAFSDEAVSRQHYVVEPADYLRRSRQAGRAAAELIAKHPEREADLIRRTRLPPSVRRYPMGALAVAPPALSAPLRRGVSALVRRGATGAATKELFFALRRVEYVRGARATRRALGRGRVLVLAYHAVTDLSGDPVLAEYGVPPEQLARQLDSLISRGHRFVAMDQLLAALDGTAPLPDRAVLLTFDDAYVDLAAGAVPELTSRGIPAVVFVVSSMIGGTNSWDRHLGAGELRLLDADGLRAVAAAGVEIGAHSVSHRMLPRLPAAELEHEVRACASQIEAAGVPRPRSFSYPHGEWDAGVANVVREAGYELAFTVEPGVARRGLDRFALPRVEVFASDRGWRFRLRVAAASWPRPARRAAYRLLGR